MKALVLDFDGVIADSSREAFLVAVQAYLHLREDSKFAHRTTREIFQPFLDLMPLGNRAEDYGTALLAIEADRELPEQEDYDAFKARLADPGGFLLAHWCGDGKCEERIQEETKATIRCLAFDQPAESGRCIVCDGTSNKRAHFAKAY